MIPAGKVERGERKQTVEESLRANDGETSESLKFSLGAKDNHRGYATQRRED
jgi:hypothetical protein